MKKTLREHLESIVDVEAREKAIANMDSRYCDEMIYTLGYALMLGVYQHTEEDKKFWRDYAKKNRSANSHYYTNQPVQQGVVILNAREILNSWKIK